MCVLVCDTSEHVQQAGIHVPLIKCFPLSPFSPNFFFFLLYSCLASFWKCRAELCFLSFSLSFIPSPAESLALFAATPLHLRVKFLWLEPFKTEMRFVSRP